MASGGGEVHAGFLKQNEALVAKNLSYQKRNYCTNICILVSPLFFTVIIYLIQLLFDSFLNTPDNRCGCQCTAFEYEGKRFNLADYGGVDWPEVINSTDSVQIPSEAIYRYTDAYGIGTINCLERNNSNCALKFSKPEQFTWCPIDSPSRIHPSLNVPLAQFRATVGDDTYGNYSGWPGHQGEEWNEGHMGEGERVTVKRAPATLLVASDAPTASQRALLDGLQEPNSAIDTPSFLLELADAIKIELGEFNGSISELGAFSPDLQAGSSEFWGLVRERVGQLGSHYEKVVRRFYQEELTAGRDAFYVTNCTLFEDLVVLLFNTSSAAFNTPFFCVDKHLQMVTSVDDVLRKLYAGYGYGEMQSGQLVRGSKPIQQYVGAINLKDSDPLSDRGKFTIEIYYNGTSPEEQGGGGGFSSFEQSLSEMLNMASRSFFGSMLARARNVMKVEHNDVPGRYLYTREMPKAGTQLSLEIASFLGPLFYTWLLQILLPVMTGQLVQEKEKRLRVIMRMHGLGDAVYWLINVTYWFIIHIMYCAMILGFGAALDISFFTSNDMGVIFVAFMMFSLVQISTALLLTSLFSSERAASVFAVFIMLATGFLGDFLLSLYIASHEKGRFSSAGLWLIQLIPSFGLYRVLWELSQYAFVGSYTNTKGLTWSVVANDSRCDVGPLMGIFVAEAIFIGMLSVYIDQVFNTGGGVERHWLFPLHMLGILTPPSSEPVSNTSDTEQPQHKERHSENADVADARIYAEEQDRRTTQCAIVTKRLTMMYPARGGMPPKVACDALSLAIERGECFGLLGPNGAGKTTAISMLTGLMKQTSGTAYIEGMDLGADMVSIHKVMGVCPQHDLLWPTLTAREHLAFYGRLKNLKGEQLSKAIDDGLRDVNLLQVKDKAAGKFSGGMKRRLSVAISLIGNPKVVFLDEPSTGLDPASRKALWRIVKNAKRKTSIVLTTHSMEEAEELCDRLGIFVGGKMQVLGNPKELTSRYGGFLVVNILSKAELQDSISDMMRQLCKDAHRTYALGGLSKWDIPLKSVSLGGVFHHITSFKDALQIEDWSISNMTLEEVFIKVCRDAGVDMGSID